MAEPADVQAVEQTIASLMGRTLASMRDDIARQFEAERWFWQRMDRSERIPFPAVVLLPRLDRCRRAIEAVRDAGYEAKGRIRSAGTMLARGKQSCGCDW